MERSWLRGRGAGMNWEGVMVEGGLRDGEGWNPESREKDSLRQELER